VTGSSSIARGRIEACLFCSHADEKYQRQELSSNTQFVIISHNRETMRQASILYGVTMGDDGISKILSVHLDQVGQGGRIKE